MADEIVALPPTLQNVLDQKTLKWIFCGLFPATLSVDNQPDPWHFYTPQVVRAVSARQLRLVPSLYNSLNVANRFC
jgi:hypothetical protein